MIYFICLKCLQRGLFPQLVHCVSRTVSHVPLKVSWQAVQDFPLFMPKEFWDWIQVTASLNQLGICVLRQLGNYYYYYYDMDISLIWLNLVQPFQDYVREGRDRLGGNVLVSLPVLASFSPRQMWRYFIPSHVS